MNIDDFCSEVGIEAHSFKCGAHRYGEEEFIRQLNAAVGGAALKALGYGNKYKIEEVRFYRPWKNQECGEEMPPNCDGVIAVRASAGKGDLWYYHYIAKNNLDGDKRFNGSCI